MLTRILIGVSVVAAAFAAPAVAAADPSPLNVNALPPINPQPFASPDGAWYSFAAPGGVTCVMDRQSGNYGCNGVLPGAPGGANVVSGWAGGPPGFANAAGPMYGATADPLPLPANTRMSFRTVSCGTDGVITSCVNTVDQSGFVISPTGTYAY